MSKPRPLRRILQDQENLHANRQSGMCWHAMVLRVAFADQAYCLELPELPEGVRFIGPDSLDFLPVLHPFGDTLPVFARDQALFSGQIAGIVLARTMEDLQYWATRIHCRPDPTQDSRQSLEPRLYKQRSLRDGDARQVLATCERTVESRFVHHAVSSGDLEDRSIIAWADESRLEIECTHPWPHLVRRIASEATGLPPKAIVVRAGYSSHLKFQRLIQSLIPCALAAIAARVLNDRVILHWPAVENQRYPLHEPEVQCRIASAHAGDGSLQALRVQIDYHLGACVLASEEIIAQSLAACLGTYQPVPVDLRVQLFAGPEAPRFPGAGFGEQLVQQALEQHWQTVARTFDLNPLVWRLEHLRQQATGPGNLRFDDSVHIAQQVLSRASTMADYSRHFVAYALQNRVLRERAHTPQNQGKAPAEFLRGMGLALAYQSGNLLTLEPGFRPTVTLTLEEDGHLQIDAPLEPGNTSVRDGWARLIEQELHHSERNMAFSGLEASSDDDPGPLILGRQYTVISPLLAEACRKMAEHGSGKNKGPAQWQSRRPAAQAPCWNGRSLEGTIFSHRTWAAAAVDLGFHPRTGTVEVRHVWLCVHTGFAMHELRAQSILRQGVRDVLSSLIQSQRLPKVNIQILPAQADRSEGLTAMDTMGGVEAIPATLIPPAFCNALAFARGLSVETYPPGDRFYLEGL